MMEETPHAGLMEGSVEEEIQRYREAQSIRQPHEADWRKAAAYCLPRHYSAWQSDGPVVSPGNSAQQARRVNFDSTGTLALPKYMAVLERLVTPHGTKWHGLTTPDKSLVRLYRVRKFFDELNDLLFQLRYEPKANFRQSASEIYASIGAYGMGPIYVGKRKSKVYGNASKLFYKACHMRDAYVLTDADGEVDTFFRRIYLNARQFKTRYPNEPMPKTLERSSGSNQESDKKEFFQVVRPRIDYGEDALDERRMPFVSRMIGVDDKVFVGKDEGFMSLPYLSPRTFTEAEDSYGFSPALQALAAMGSASSMKKTVLKQGQKAVDPVLLTHDDGVLNGRMNMRPGAQNPGGLDRQGRLMVQPLPMGNFQVSEKLLEDERRDINDSFFVTLFQILIESPEMTATEVMERTAEKAALLSPTMGRLQSEFAGPCIGREIDVLTEAGLMPEIPPELIEAKGEYEVVYTSPMAKAMYAEEVSGFMRSVEFATGVVQNTGDPSHLDHFNFDTAIPEISDRMAAPARWMHTDEERRAVAEARGQAQQQQQILQNAAPIAGALRAAAEMQKGGRRGRG